MLSAATLKPRSRSKLLFGDTWLRSETLQALAELFRASADNSGVRGIASRHRCPAALLDDRSAIPRGGLFELDQSRRRIGLMLEFLDADRREYGNHRGLRSLFRHSLGSAAERPSQG